MYTLYTLGEWCANYLLKPSKCIDKANLVCLMILSLLFVQAVHLVQAIQFHLSVQLDLMDRRVQPVLVHQVFH